MCNFKKLSNINFMKTNSLNSKKFTKNIIATNGMKSVFGGSGNNRPGWPDGTPNNSYWPTGSAGVGGV